MAESLDGEGALRYQNGPGTMMPAFSANLTMHSEQRK
jgi:hypothetical protein